NRRSGSGIRGTGRIRTGPSRCEELARVQAVNTRHFPATGDPVYGAVAACKLPALAEWKLVYVVQVHAVSGNILADSSLASSIVGVLRRSAACEIVDVPRQGVGCLKIKASRHGSLRLQRQGIVIMPRAVSNVVDGGVLLK